MTPPGVQGEWFTVCEGGGDSPWIPLRHEKHYTNAFVWDKTGSRVLLGLKKRGFGVNKWNGFGGKVDQSDPTPLDAAKRELKEEAGIEAPLEERGTLVFYDEDESFCHYIHIFRALEWSGEPSESEEMRPQWFDLSPQAGSTADALELGPIPFDDMWEDDKYWFPMLLSDAKFIGRVDFSGMNSNGTGGSMRRWWFGRDRSE